MTLLRQDIEKLVNLKDLAWTSAISVNPHKKVSLKQFTEHSMALLVRRQSEYLSIGMKVLQIIEFQSIARDVLWNSLKTQLSAWYDQT